MSKTATLEKPAGTEVTQLRARVFGKFIKLDADPSETGTIRAAIPFSMKSLNDEDRTIEFIGSTAAQDRYGDVIVQTGWELANFMSNPVIPWGHNYHEPPVAKAVEVAITGEGLKFKGQFATADEYDYADTIYKLYKGGYLRAFSVGFIPLAWEIKKDEDGSPYFVFTKCELLEVSCVTVPANPEALTLSVKEGILTAREKSLMVSQAEKLIKSLTDEDESVISTGMNDETKAYIDEQIKSLADSLAEIKELVSVKSVEDEQEGEQPKEDTEEPANPSGEPDGGTADAVTDEELRSMVRSGLNYQLGKIE